MPRTHRPIKPDALDLDFETAPDVARKPVGRRAYVGGVLYLEGIIVFVMGTMLLLSYWPPVSAHGERPNPVSQIGMWLAVSALIYMVVVGVGIFFYNIRHPAARLLRNQDDDNGTVARARRYASMKRRTYYIFDKTICSAQDAEEAINARDLY